MATTMEEPPPLLDAVNTQATTPSSERKSGESNRSTPLIGDKSATEIDDNETWFDDNMYDETEEEDEDDEEDSEEEDEFDEDEEEETEFDSEDEEEEDEESEESDDPQPDMPKRLFVYHPSDEDFQESNLEDRKKRRYLIGTHSFLELTDPHLENALVPADAGAEDEALTKEEKEKRSLKDEKNFYRDTCAELGVKPEPKVLASLRLPIMDLKGMGMNAKEIIAVCKLLEKNQHVRFLNLSGNAVGLDGGLAVAELIAQNSIIAGYDLSGTEILEAFEAICNALAQNPVIQYLNFSKNELEDIDMSHLKKVIRDLPELTTLILNANFIKDDGLRHIGQGLANNVTLELIDLSHNKIMGEKKAAPFFTACAEHPVLQIVNLRRNFITDEGGKAVARILGNSHIEELDASFNLMGEGSAPAISRSLGRHPARELKILQLELQRWYQDHAATILKPFGNTNLEIPIELIDFGMMLDVHTIFLKAKERTLKAHPNVKIIHGQTYGLDHAKGPDHKALVIRKADAVCKSFETTLVMLMEELAKEKKVLTVPEFKKFLKQCNLYKDKTVTEAFEKVFAKPGSIGVPQVDAEAILEAFDKEYPGLRVIPDPVDEDEEEEMEEKPPKKKKGKKGKGKDKKGKGGGGGKASKKGGKKK